MPRRPGGALTCATPLHAREEEPIVVRPEESSREAITPRARVCCADEPTAHVAGTDQGVTQVPAPADSRQSKHPCLPAVVAAAKVTFIIDGDAVLLNLPLTWLGQTKACPKCPLPPTLNKVSTLACLPLSLLRRLYLLSMVLRCCGAVELYFVVAACDSLRRLVTACGSLWQLADKHPNNEQLYPPVTSLHQACCTFWRFGCCFRVPLRPLLLLINLLLLLLLLLPPVSAELSSILFGV